MKYTHTPTIVVKDSDHGHRVSNNDSEGLVSFKSNVVIHHQISEVDAG